MVGAFIGHRKIEYSKRLENNLIEIVTNLIENENADVFLFGSRSEFDSLCYRIVTELKFSYKYIRRIFVRAEYEYIDKSYTEYLLESYEETYYPEEISGAGRLAYIKRNNVMVDKCDVLITYCDEEYQPKSRRGNCQSGTKIAVDYAKKKIFGL